MTEARTILVDRSLNLRDTLAVRPGSVKVGYPWISLHVSPARASSVFDRARTRPTARELAYIETQPSPGLQVLVLDTLIQALVEAGHPEIAELGDFKIGQHFRLAIDESAAQALAAAQPAEGDQGEESTAERPTGRLFLESLVDNADAPRIALGDMPQEFLDGFFRTAQYAVSDAVHKQAFLLSPAELAEMVTPVVVKAGDRTNTDSAMVMTGTSLSPELRIAGPADRRCELVWKASDGMLAHLGPVFNVMGGEGESLRDRYYLELISNGRLLLGYSRSIGSRQLAQLGEHDMAELIARGNSAVEAFNEGQTDAERQSRPTGTLIVRREQARRTPAPVLAQTDTAAAPVDAPATDSAAAQDVDSGEGPLETVPAVAPVAAFAAEPADAGNDPVHQQLAMLHPDGNRIILPEQQLSEYAAIRDRMLHAGFKYKKKGGICFFEGHEGADGAAVLAQLVSGARVNIQKETQFFGTQPEQAEDVVIDAEITAGMRVLEPSAGNGGLADPARARGAEVITVENWEINAKALRAKGYDPIERDFLEVTVDDIGGSVDAVVMNPPFNKGADMRHVQHALSFLKPEGVLVSITSPRAGLGTTKAQKKFARILALAGAERTTIEAGAFAKSGTDISTCKFRIEMSRLLAGVEAQASERGDADSVALEKELGIDLSHVRAYRDSEGESEQEGRDRPRDRG